MHPTHDPCSEACSPVHATEPAGLLNAFACRWLPVTTAHGQAHASSADLLRGTTPDGATITGLGADLTPLERDAALRFHIALAGLALRLGDVEEGERVTQIPETGIDALVERYSDRAWLRHPTMPLCQEWGLPQDDSNPKIRPIAYLDPAVAGSSSSQWGVAPGTVEQKSAALADDFARLLLLAIVAWYHTKHSNATDAQGRKFGYGNPGDVAVRALGVYPHHRASITKTLLANVPSAWLDSDSLPAFLDRDGESLPSAAGAASTLLAGSPHDLWRTTYSRNIALLHWNDDAQQPAATGFVIGPSARPVPLIDATEEAALKAMHALDPSRLFEVKVNKKTQQVERSAVSAIDARLSSTEGYMRWYANHLAATLSTWRDDVAPVLALPGNARRGGDWFLGAFAEISDTQGNRKWLDYAFVPYGSLEAPNAMDDGTPGPPLLLVVTAELRRCLNGPLLLASEGHGGQGKAALKARADRALLAAVEEPLVKALALGPADPFDIHAAADDLLRIAFRIFDEMTAPFLTPVSTPAVSTARQRYRAFANTAVRKALPDRPAPAPTPDFATIESAKEAS